MPIKIRGSISAIVNKKLRASSRKLSNAVAKAWTVEVNKSFLSSQAKSRYTKAIKPYNGLVGAYISDHVAKLLETGFDSFDMKPGFLKGVLYKRIPINGKVRTVSVKSPTSSWIHPGIEGARAIEKTKKKLMSRMQALVREALR
jgi:hypothetical protein